jgi:SAM-dependent methyltransferase
MLGAAAVQDTRLFPVPLVCPTCAHPFTPDDHCECDDAKLSWWHGLPRTLFGQDYWGETSQATMERLLKLIDTTPWRDALVQVAESEPITKHLLEEIGTDFVYSMPWDRIRTVLEIGAGMGFMTAPLAKFAERVIALEAVPERALFLAKRARQDGLDNVHPIIASGTALPFAPASFDLVALNGVFEYIGLWGKGAPGRLQQEFLHNVQRLLKPGGYVYIGIETRFGMGSWLGTPDHSGLRFTSLMPRWLADWYCRRRRVPFYGSASAANGYRTYTHSPRRYLAMLREAGFETARAFGVFDGYNRQIGIAPLDDFRAWQTIRAIVDAPCSLLGRLRRVISHNRLTFRALENEVVLFACKRPDAGSLFWSDLQPTGSIAQLNTGKKVATLHFEDGRPTVIAKAAKNDAAHQRLEQKYALLEQAQAALGDEVESYPLRWPKPLGQGPCQGLELFRWEFAGGALLSKLLLPGHYRPRRFARLLKQLTGGYVHLCARLTHALGSEARTTWPQLLDSLRVAQFSAPTLKQRLDAACRRLAQRDWSLQVTHGDLTFNNVILMSTGQMMLIDWENVSREGLPAIDLLRLLYDAWMDGKGFRPRQARKLLASVRGAVTEALLGLGVRMADFRDLELIFVAHQHAFDHARKCEVQTLLSAYGDPSFSLFKET